MTKERKIEYGVIHCHTENSIKDSAMSAQGLVDKAVSLGAPAVTLTDHGVLTGVYEFMEACKNAGIKGIPGVEAYVQEEDNLNRSHLILLPKNYEGYKAISRAVSQSFNRMAGTFPRMNKEILENCFKEGENVIATSACMQGVLGNILLQNKAIELEIAKEEKKLSKYEDPNSPAYKKNLELKKEKSEKVASLTEEKKVLEKKASAKFAGKEKALLALKKKGTEEEIKIAEEKLSLEKKEAEEAKQKLEEVKEALTKEKRAETQLRKKIKEIESTHDKWRSTSLAISNLKEKITKEEDLKAKVIKEAKYFINLFGEGNFFIELQYHGLKDEEYVMPILDEISDMLNIPKVLANDVHMPDNSPQSIRARRLVNSLRFNRWEEEGIGDGELFMKTDEELKSSLLKILPKESVEKGMKGIEAIINSCAVIFPEKSHFPKFLDDNGKSIDTKKRLREMAEKGIPEKYPTWTSELQERLDYELDIIDKAGYNDYLCIVEDFLRYGRKLGKDNPEKVGLGVGPGRGSAVGSLVCYLIGITGVDPIKYGLIFERFLNLERVSSPDIDSDFAIDKRELVLDYVKEKYGEDAVCNIMTKGTLAAKNAIRSAARLLGDARYGDPKALLGIGDEISRSIPSSPGTKLNACDFSKFTSKDALQIIEDAKLIEGVTIQYGIHAAGVIISDNGDVGEYIPLMRTKEGEPILCQSDMVEAEEKAGLLKFDFLGLRNLNIISDALRLIYLHKGTSLDIEEVGRSLVNGRTTPFDVRGNVFDDIFSKGKTNSVFQFESGGMKSMLKRFKPRNIEEVIMLVAVYRPGPLQYIDSIIKVKSGEMKPEYIVPEMEEILKDTYGYPVYQEQIMQIFHRIAGFTLGEADQIRRAMGKKKLEKMLVYKEKFFEGLEKRGASKEAIEKFWEELMDFASYAFNKSHAAAYAMVAYYTAWLKLNYPAEYMTAVLNYTVQEKIPLMVSECEELGIKVLPPDINKSGTDFTLHNGEILFGLGSIKNVGKAVDSIIEERNKMPFHSYKDFLTRAHQKKDVTEALIDAGALDSWCFNRTAMKIMIEPLVKDDKRIKEKQSLLAKEKDEKKRISLEKKLKEYQARFNEAILPIQINENKLERLELEKKLCGMYITGHPLNEYEGVEEGIALSDVEEGNLAVTGMIGNIRKAKRKIDGKDMAFFTLEDKTGIINVSCFTKAFSEYGGLIEEGNVVKIFGLVKEEDDGEEVRFILFANKITQLPKRLKKVMISVPDLGRYMEITKELESYKGNDFELIIHDQMLGEIRKTNRKVNDEILKANIPYCEISIMS